MNEDEQMMQAIALSLGQDTTASGQVIIILSSMLVTSLKRLYIRVLPVINLLL